MNFETLQFEDLPWKERFGSIKIDLEFREQLCHLEEERTPESKEMTEKQEVFKFFPDPAGETLVLNLTITPGEKKLTCTTRLQQIPAGPNQVALPHGAGRLFLDKTGAYIQFLAHQSDQHIIHTIEHQSGIDFPVALSEKEWLTIFGPFLKKYAYVREGNVWKKEYKPKDYATTKTN